MTSPVRRRPAGGFTLLEVLAAVAILGLWYVVLAGIAMQGLRNEGESARRLRASLLADQVLSEVEAAIAGGAVPPLGEEEREEGDYVVRVEVANLALPWSLEDPEAGRGRAPAGREAQPSLLAPQNPREPGPLREIRVEVSWLEGVAEERVLRTTYAVDLETLLQARGTDAGGGGENPLDQAAEEEPR